MNELLIIASLVVIYGITLLSYRFFGKNGLFAMMVFSTVMANIEVLMVVKAFGIEQTLGNVLFASTFVITDILSENEGKKSADKAVAIGVLTSVLFLVITLSWLLYIPAASDDVTPHIRAIFTRSVRVVIASVAVYAFSQFVDVRLYHFLWKLTRRRYKDTRAYLWLRNNGATLISQIINTVLFNTLAFAGVYTVDTLASIMISSYLIYVAMALIDTPIVYLARCMKEKGYIKEEKEVSSSGADADDV